MSNALALFGAAPKGMLSETDKTIGLMGSTAFVATQKGSSLDAVKAHRDMLPLVKDKKSGEMRKPSLAASARDLLTTKGLATEAEIKALYKTYDSNRNQVFESNRQQNALLAVDPTLKIAMRAYKNAKGEVIRIQSNYTKASAGISAKQRVKQLEAQIASMIAKQAKALPVAAAVFSSPQVETL